MIYLVSIVINLFLVLLLLTKKNKNTADIILLIWLFITSLHLSIFVIIYQKQFYSFPNLFGIEQALPLLHGPILYLYTKALTSAKKFSWLSLLHFLPAILVLFYIFPFILLPIEEKIPIYNQSINKYANFQKILVVCIVLSGFTYITLSLKLLTKYKKLLTDNFSYTDKINLDWLYRLIIGLAGIWLIILFVERDDVIFASVAVYVLFIGYYGIKHVGVFSNYSHTMTLEENQELKEVDEFSVNGSTKYQYSNLTDDVLTTLNDKLTDLMNQRKLFLEPDLTLSILAQELDINPNTLSEVINRIQKMNFYDYVNKLRVEEFKVLVTIPTNKKFTLLALAYQSGFNSKTSFNRNFKKITGLIPSEYVSKIKNTDE